MLARWHLGPVSDWEFWKVLAFSPEILVFLFFMITDPRTIPESRPGRRAYAVAIGLLAALLLAPQTTEFGAKVAVLSALALVCAARPLLLLLLPVLRSRTRLGGALDASAAVRRARRRSPAPSGSSACSSSPGRPARSSAEATVLPAPAAGELPAVSVQTGTGIAPIDRRTAERIARDVVADLENESEALRRRDRGRATAGADGARLAAVWRQIDAAGGGAVDVPRYEIERVRVTLEPSDGQAPPTVVARVRERSSVRRAHARRFVGDLRARAEGRPLPDHRRARSAQSPPFAAARSDDLGGVQLRDVAAEVGLDFRHGAFRFGVTNEPEAMMGGGLCWLDYDNDGWLDLFVVNAYGDDELARWTESGGAAAQRALPQRRAAGSRTSARGSGADLQLRGNGCVAADFNLDGNTDLFVTTAGYNAATNGYDALLWGNGDGTFTEGARAAGINDPGWHSGAAVGDVNGDGLPDLFVAGYADPNVPVPSSAAGFPANVAGVRDRLYLNQGPDGNGRARFREVGKQAGLEKAQVDHGLGAVFTDVDDDGRLDLYVANDLDPNRLYLNRPRPGGARIPLRRARAQRGRRRPECRHGGRGRGLQPRRARGPVRDELAPTAARRLPQLAHGVHRRAPRLRPGARHGLHRLGRFLDRSRPRRQSRPRPGQRRDPDQEPRDGRRAAAGAREPDGRGRVAASSPTQVTPSG